MRFLRKFLKNKILVVSICVIVVSLVYKGVQKAIDSYNLKNNNVKQFNNAIGYGTTLEEISHNIFKLLRQIDKYNKELIIIEGVKPEGLGLAIMNRLIRACSHNYIKL